MPNNHNPVSECVILSLQHCAVKFTGESKIIILAAVWHSSNLLKSLAWVCFSEKHLPTSPGCYMNQASWSPQSGSMASRLEANKHDGNGPYLVTMDTADIKDSYLWYSSATTNTKSHMPLGPGCGHKCLLHIHDIHGTAKAAEPPHRKQYVSFPQCPCVSRFPSGEVKVLFCN